MTRNASQAFAARSGNCLSLVIMTAAFAKELGMPVRFQQVFTDETWSRIGDFYLSIGHVNLSLGRPLTEHVPRDASMTIDFLPPKDMRGLETWALDESTIVAMYMNNRAVESMTAGNVDEAYWWAREAIRQDARFLSAVNTLGVVYQAHGNLPQAQKALEFVLEREPANTRAMSNLASVLLARGDVAAAQELTRKLAAMEPEPPFGYYKRGLAAINEGNYRLARDMFAKEVARAAYYHEFHFWLAIAYVGLGDLERAREHMTIAAENSTTRKERDLYGAKLDRLRAGVATSEVNRAGGQPAMRRVSRRRCGAEFPRRRRTLKSAAARPSLERSRTSRPFHRGHDRPHVRHDHASHRSSAAVTASGLSIAHMCPQSGTTTLDRAGDAFGNFPGARRRRQCILLADQHQRRTADRRERRTRIGARDDRAFLPNERRRARVARHLAHGFAKVGVVAPVGVDEVRVELIGNVAVPSLRRQLDQFPPPLALLRRVRQRGRVEEGDPLDALRRLAQHLERDISAHRMTGERESRRSFAENAAGDVGHRLVACVVRELHRARAP